MSAHTAKQGGFSAAQQGAASFAACLIAFVTFVSIARGRVEGRHARLLERAEASTLRMATRDGAVAGAHFTGSKQPADTDVTLAE